MDEVSKFGSGTGAILMSKVNCNGDEKSLSNCSHSSEPGSCDHDEDAGVICINTTNINGDGESLI